MISADKISRRAQSIDSSGIRKVFDLAAKLKDPINLSIGQPDFDAWPELRQALKTAVDSRKSGYTVTQGIEPVREKIRQRYRLADPRTSGVDVFLTSGVSGGLVLSFMAVLDPGDEILVPDPAFCIYHDLAKLISASPIYFNTYPDFKLRVEEIERVITPRTRAIIVNSPGNPTGYAVSQAELDEVIALARKYDLWLIYDEIYEAFCYDIPHARANGQYEKTIILGGFAKSHGIPGWRIGYAIGPVEVVQQMLKMQQYTFVCAPSIVQWAMVDGIDLKVQERITSPYREKRDFVYNALKNHFAIRKPGGAFYLFPEAPGGSGQAFVERCIASNLLVIPGTVFSRADTHFRISFAAPHDVLERGVEVLCQLASAR